MSMTTNQHAVLVSVNFDLATMPENVAHQTGLKLAAVKRAALALAARHEIHIIDGIYYAASTKPVGTLAEIVASLPGETLQGATNHRLPIRAARRIRVPSAVADRMRRVVPVFSPWQ